ncbi:hypothetical protein F4677DRAFT_459020 [Hypoxylon crocopeplum]|nr:hypothetical protein F4677DRAFT_459020 [Hypoxylon crocopeplum]
MTRDNGTAPAEAVPHPLAAAHGLGPHATVNAAGTHDSAHGAGPQSQPIVDGNIHAIMNQFNGLGINGIPQIPGMFPVATHDGRIIQVAANYPSSSLHAAGIPGFGYPPAPEAPYPASYGSPYLAHGGFQHPMFAFGPYTPARAGLSHERTNTSSRDVPGLDIRRSSYSTNESTPATPFLGSMMSRDQGPRVTVFDRSTYTTPSPQQFMAAEDPQEPKTPLLNRSPEIPRAIPAVFTPPENMRTLEQSLSNPIPGNRNVYIRGLHPTTDDELLSKYAERFGHVETSKAIIDSTTGACKGFGFARFYDVRDSEMCIRGFYRRGYEVGFARESFNSRLRAEGDPSSTNLYFSNLPKSYGEQELCTIFLGYTVLSSKVLRDNMGNSRGVGFARHANLFESREDCEGVMTEYLGRPIGLEKLPLQIRYADTQAQKDLKRVTAERRQFRTNEYNVSAFGTTLVGLTPTNSCTNRQGGQGGQGALGGQGAGSHSGRPRGGSGGFKPGVGDGVEIRVDSPLVAHGSSQSSPVKHEKE